MKGFTGARAKRKNRWTSTGVRIPLLRLSTKKGREHFAPARLELSRNAASLRLYYLHVLAPGLPLHLFEQHSTSSVHDEPGGRPPRFTHPPPSQAGSPVQSASAQSTSPSQSLSAPSSHTSADGVQLHAGSALQSLSSQSVAPSQSLSAPSSQTSVDGVHPAGSRYGATLS